MNLSFFVPEKIKLLIESMFDDDNMILINKEITSF